MSEASVRKHLTSVGGNVKNTEALKGLAAHSQVPCLSKLDESIGLIGQVRIVTTSIRARPAAV